MFQEYSEYYYEGDSASFGASKSIIIDHTNQGSSVGRDLNLK